MKLSKITKFTILTIILLIIPTITYANFYNIDYECKNDMCLSNEPTYWNITIFNQGKTTIEIISIELKDAINETIFANFSVDYSPHTDTGERPFEIHSGFPKSMIINSNLPDANQNNSLLYYLCFKTAVQEQVYAKESVYSIEYCYDDLLETMPSLECIINGTCNADEECKENKCQKIECKDCQYIEGHACANYECCDANVCLQNETCEDHLCKNLECKYDEFVFNHTCIPLACSEEEIIINHTCSIASCSFDEYIANNTCHKLNCLDEELIINHTCNRLECGQDEIIINKTCQKLNCLFNESAANHSCRPLKCPFYQKIANHKCINNNVLILRMSIEIFVILIIVSLIYFDMQRYKKRKKPKK